MVQIETRFVRLLNKMSEKNIRQAFITKKENIYYLTGISIDFQDRFGGLILRENGKHCFFVNEVLVSDLTKKVKDTKIIYWSDGEDPLKQLVTLFDFNYSIAIEQSCPAVLLLSLLKTNVEWVFENIDPLINELRMIKEPDEIAFLKKSASISDAVMYEWFQLPFDSFSEKNASFAVRELFAFHDVYDLSLDPIVSFGKSSADPIHQPTACSFAENMVMLSVGCKANYYCSNITRMYFNDKPLGSIEDAYHVVYEAQQQVMNVIKPGLPVSLIDHIGSELIKNAGYANYFTHRLGQGIGLELNEPPFITTNNNQIIQPGMVLTIEPGIYIPGEFGIKLGDVVIITDSGCEVINQSPKSLNSIILN